LHEATPHRDHHGDAGGGKEKASSLVNGDEPEKRQGPNEIERSLLHTGVKGTAGGDNAVKKKK